MKLIIHFIGLCAVLHVAASEYDRERKDNTNSVADGMQGFGLELILIKLDAMEHRLQQMESMQVQLQKIEDKIEENRFNHEQTHKEMFAVIQKLEHQVARNSSEVNNQYQENVNAALRKLDEDVGVVLKYHQKQIIFSSCKDVPSNVSGTYQIRVKSVGVSVPFEVYCEQKAFGGGWIVFQYRYDGSLDFYRGWNEFRDGFGDLNKEFWLGLEKVHQITSGRKHELIVELKDFSGRYKYVRYDAFEIGSESEQYKIKILGKYNGTAGDQMSYNKGIKFSTKDRDNDDSIGHCAQKYEGAWWYSSCTWVNLNGRYINAIGGRSMSWYDFKKNYQGLSYSRMMIRELDQ